MTDFIASHVRRIYVIAGHDERRPPGIGPIAAALLGDEVFEVPTGSLPRGCAAQLARYRGTWRISTFEASPRDALIVAIAVAVATWYATVFCPGESVDATELAAHLLLPSPAIEAQGEAQDYDAERIASFFDIPLAVARQRVRDVFSPDRSGSMRRIDLTG